MYHEAHFYSVCFGAGGQSVTSLLRMGYFMGYLYLAWIRKQGVDEVIKSRVTCLKLFSLIVTQETDSVMDLAGAEGSEERGEESGEGYRGSHQCRCHNTITCFFQV